MRNILLGTGLFVSFIYFFILNELEYNDINLISKDKKYDSPHMFSEIHNSMRTPEGSYESGYKPNNQINELNKAIKSFRAKNNSNSRIGATNNVIEWTERGPSNFPGRVRGVVVDPDDPTDQTFFVGSASGGIWKTSNGGQSWVCLTPQIANLATPTLAMAGSNHDIIYAGLGEGFSNFDRVSGSGLLRSIDRGETWSLLTNTSDFAAVNRIIINPNDEKVVIVATDLGVFRTNDNAVTWNKVYNGRVQDLRYVPQDFDTQYAGAWKKGVIKSTDGGRTWENKFSSLMGPSGRIEVAISPVNNQYIFASAEGSFSDTYTDFLYSMDGGDNWTLSDISIGNKTLDYLSAFGSDQGGYSNAIEADPFDPNVVFVGGIGLYRLSINPFGITDEQTIYGVENNSDFITLVDADFNQFHGSLGVKDVDAKINVEIRFGKDPNDETNNTILKQKAYLFRVPEGRTSGVDDDLYSYHGYVDVPFQVWNVTSNPPVQLMVSFRDQGRDGEYNLIESNTEGEAIDQSREYIFIHSEEYSDNPNPRIAVSGGHSVSQLYSFWPVLKGAEEWDSNRLPDSNIKIYHSTLSSAPVSAVTLSDPYEEYDGKNSFDSRAREGFITGPHPDHHNIMIIPESKKEKTFRILIATDGGVFLTKPSTKPGTNQGDFPLPVIGLNNSQFYGANKCPGKDRFIGGTQDNGTLISSVGTKVQKSSKYSRAIGGDGFEVLWNNYDHNLIIGSSQFGDFEKSIDGGLNWRDSNSGLRDGSDNEFPFLSRLSNSVLNPNRIYTLGKSGVYFSNNFGDSWNLTEINDDWTHSSFMDIEVSRSNPNIVWAGVGMNSNNKLHVSTDAGLTFNSTNNYKGAKSLITNIGSHPTKPETAFACFAVAESPKILRTDDLGTTWYDISGFESNRVSSNGFPDVAVYCVFVRPDNPKIIWAGTEIGIIESLDEGGSWNIIPNDEFPNVSVWQITSMDSSIVVATHGRGIWTAKVDKDITYASTRPPVLVDMGTGPSNQFAILIQYSQVYDSTIVYTGNYRVQKFLANTIGKNVQILENLGKAMHNIKVVSYKDGIPYHSNTLRRDNFETNEVVDSYFNNFNTNEDISSSNFRIALFTRTNSILKTNPSPYLANSNIIASLEQPIKVNSENSNLDYWDIAIVEPPSSEDAVFGQDDFNDYVVVEGSKDGANWIPIGPGYNCASEVGWHRTFTAGNAVISSLFVHHNYKLIPTFQPNDEIVIRFRLFSNDAIQGWGWAIDNLHIQNDALKVESKEDDNFILFPNPSKGYTTLQYSLSSPASTHLEIFNSSGQLEMRYIWNNQEGKYEEQINLTSLSDGLYLFRLSTPEITRTIKMVLKKE